MNLILFNNTIFIIDNIKEKQIIVTLDVIAIKMEIADTDLEMIIQIDIETKIKTIDNL